MSDRANSAELRGMVRTEFQGPLDLVIDDASHMYDLTKKSFRDTFSFASPWRSIRR